MPDQPEENIQPAPPVPSAVDLEELGRQKHKAKVRSAWISFAGRIVAQVLGAAAAVVLGLLVFRHSSMQSGNTGTSVAPAGSPVAHVSRVRNTSQVALAVLPLENVSGDPRQEYLADGLTEALISDLSHIKGLQVISRTSSMFYKGQRRPLPEIGKALAVDWIIEGSMLKDGGRIRIRVQLIDAKSDEHMWAFQYDKNMGEVLALQAEVSSAVAKEVSLTLKSK